MACPHNRAQLDVSSHAAEADYTRPPLAKRKAATTKSGRVQSGPGNEFDESLFPGPLVLPADALSIDPKEPPQSFRSWAQEKMRNPVTQQRKTLYVAPFPEVARELASVQTWTVPAGHKDSKENCAPPKVEDVIKYLEAFYHGLPVKLLPEDVRLVPWTEGNAKKGHKTTPDHIGLQLGTSITRITTRPSPDGAFPCQLNLNDILDGAIEALPSDAYAFLLLTHHDLYEDDDDDFCCGRAYGASRVAVVSAARYHPALDDDAGIDREHMWPASHCADYVEAVCRDASSGTGRDSKRRKTTTTTHPGLTTDSPMRSIIQTPSSNPNRKSKSTPKHKTNLPGLWLSRLSRTASHELGHTLCLDHCIYYACVMQSTASLAEDTRQPPYLCPVCLAKLTRAVYHEGSKATSNVSTRSNNHRAGNGIKEEGERGYASEGEWVVGRYRALEKVCGTEGWDGVGMFEGLGKWVGKRVAELEGFPAAGLFESKNLGGQGARFGG